ncbi:hypothetical protein BDP27DRAFT_1418267 [Rhodocollybia butyracea]|uniref:Uncharacterized protein n=1 Tax=Rhodocollybia butyracea TaxID=206335 RepID=A0A9P5UAT8_9AGAR|nr:hypothetical protein BDP27DRAFT_1418267 [Rhodocollybia butyracea]
MLTNINLSDLAALSAAAVSVIIADTTATYSVQPILQCQQFQPLQMWPIGGSSGWNIVTAADGVTSQFQSIQCPGFSLSYPGEIAKASNFRAQGALQPTSESDISFTITPVVAGQSNGPFFISMANVPFGFPIYMTGWAPNLTFGLDAPLVFEDQNTADVRQQFQLLGTECGLNYTVEENDVLF